MKHSLASAGAFGWNSTGLLLTASFISMTAVMNAPAVAQEDQAEPFDLGTIVVEARRVEEGILEVPESVAVVETDRIIESVGTESTDIARRVPNYDVVDQDWPRANFASIRGVGNLGFPLNPFDNTIGNSVDGNPVSLYGAYSQLLDVERVEVVRGPQNVLFGRGSQAGNINYVTRKADGVRDFRFRTEFGNEGSQVTDLIMGGAFSDNAAGRLALRYASQDGFIPNNRIGDDLGSSDTQAARGSLRFQLGEDTTLTLSGYYENDERDSARFILRDSPDFPESGLDERPTNDREMFNFNAELEHQFERFDLTFNLGTQDITSKSEIDTADGLIYGIIAPGLPVDIPGLNVNRYTQEEETLAGELRLTSKETADVRWIAGLSFYHSDFNQDSADVSALLPFLNGRSVTDLKLQSLSAFGEVSIPVAPNWTLTPSLRVGRDKFDYSNTFTPAFGAPFQEDDSRSESWWAGGVSAEYSFGQQGLVYASVTRGHSSGGFALFNANAPLGIAQEPYPESTSVTYELGGKTSALDGNLLLSGAIFHNDVKDGHLFEFDFTTGLTTIASQDYTSSGFELEGGYFFNDGTLLTGGIGYTDSKLDGGGRVPGVAEWSMNLAVEKYWVTVLFGLAGELFAIADIQHVTGRTADVANSFDLEDYTTVNARLGWETQGLSVYLYGRNLTDELVEASGSEVAPGVQAVVIGRGREIGIGLEAAF